MSEDALLSLAREKRADLLAGQAQVERALAAKEWQRAQAKPDWTLLFGYKRTTGFDTLLAGVTVPLPLFDRNLGNISHSETEIERTRFLLNSSLSQMRAEVAGALAAIRRIRAALDRMHKAMLEQAEESRRISYSAYQEGGADLLRLLDAQRVSNEVQLLHTRTEMEYRLSLAALEEAVGEENLQLSEELLRVQP
jgi:cobalt-zinc-cadmium efflux system outer membrane protein